MEEISQDEREKIGDEERRKLIKELRRGRNASHGSHEFCKSLSKE